MSILDDVYPNGMFVMTSLAVIGQDIAPHRPHDVIFLFTMVTGATLRTMCFLRLLRSPSSPAYLSLIVFVLFHHCGLRHFVLQKKVICHTLVFFENLRVSTVQQFY